MSLTASPPSKDPREATLEKDQIERLQGDWGCSPLKK